ncbi:MAG: exodeoxyribonuclease III [bacterium]
MQIKLISWNINGLRAAIKKGLWEKLNQINADAVNFQETKSDDQIMSSIFTDFKQIDSNSLLENEINPTQAYSEKSKIIWHSCSLRKGYSGVATVWKDSNLQLIDYQIGMQNPEFDGEGRLTVIKFHVRGTDHQFTLINGYYPQGGRGPHRIEFKLNFYKEVVVLVKKLKSKGEKIILCGDLNTTIKDQDLARPKENKKTTGCLPEERVALNWLIEDAEFEKDNLVISNPDFINWQNTDFQKLNFIDSFRYFYPDLKDKYTYWDQITRARERNVGWRIDYFIIDKDLLPFLKSAQILDKVLGSDHCPIEIVLEFDKK